MVRMSHKECDECDLYDLAEKFDLKYQRLTMEIYHRDPTIFMT